MKEGAITTDAVGIKRIIREYYEKHYTELNRDELDKFLKDENYQSSLQKKYRNKIT